MAEITPCFYSNLILNHSPILSQWIKIMKCGLSAYPPLSPLLCFSWIIFFSSLLLHPYFFPFPFGVLGYGDHDDMNIPRKAETS